MDKAAPKKSAKEKSTGGKAARKSPPEEARVLSFEPSEDPCALVAGKLLAKLRGGHYWAAGKLWRVRCRRIYEPSTADFAVTLSVKGVQCPVEGTHLALAELERVIAPFHWDEVPDSLRAGVLDLYLRPLLQPLFNAPCTIYEMRDRKSLTEEESLSRFCIEIEAEVEQQEDEGEANPLLGTKKFRLHCSIEEGEVVESALKPRRFARHYPPALVMAWSLCSGRAQLTVEEMRALEAGDIILLEM